MRLMNEIQLIPELKLEPESTLKVSDINIGFDAADEDMMEGFEDMMNEEEFDEWTPEEPTTSKPKKRRRKSKYRHESHDEKEEKVRCTICSKSIIKSYIRKHIHRMHMGMKNFSCDLCGKKFYRQSTIEGIFNNVRCILLFKTKIVLFKLTWTVT